MDLVTEVFIIVSLFADLNKLVVVWRCSVCDNAKARSSNVSFSKIIVFGIKFKLHAINIKSLFVKCIVW